MKKQVIIATLALALAAGTSVISFAEDITTKPSVGVEEETEFLEFGRSGSCGYGGRWNRMTDEEKEEFYAEREARREACFDLTNEEREELYEQRDAEREERRAQRSSLTDEELEEFFAQRDAGRKARRAVVLD